MSHVKIEKYRGKKNGIEQREKNKENEEGERGGEQKRETRSLDVISL